MQRVVREWRKIVIHIRAWIASVLYGMLTDAVATYSSLEQVSLTNKYACRPRKMEEKEQRKKEESGPSE